MSPYKDKSAKKYVYDIEVFPNFFCAIFMDCDTHEKFKFVIYKDTDDRKKLNSFLDNEILLIGYNNLSYDGPVLQFIQNHPGAKDINSQLFKISGRLISDDSRQDDDIKKLRWPRNVKWSQMDLLKIMAFDMLGVSLKQVAINLKWYRIQDLPLPYDYRVEPSDVQTILDYNLNDVLITYELYMAIQPQIQLRDDLGKLFDADLTSASDSKMANILLEKIYAEETGIDVSSLRNLRTKRSEVNLGECLGNNIEFETEELKQLKNEIEAITVYAESKFAYKKSIYFGGIEYVLGVGGLHSNDNPAKFFATDEYLIRDADVASYYPSMIINNDVKPEHLGKDFVRILQKITKERLEAKKSGDKIKADGLKITINSIFGKLGSDTFWLEDAKAMLAVTVSGQLYLLMLIEKLVLSGISVISANTDGIVSKIPIKLESAFFDACKWWQHKTGFELEYTDYIQYIRSDVNNYITKKADGKTKEKGRYLKQIDLKKGYKYPIVPQCLYEYFIHGTPVEQTLENSRDILDFCISQKSGKDFKVEYHTLSGIEVLQKTNRFYISTKGGSLIKRNIVSNSPNGLYVGKLVRILNDFDKDIPFSEYNVNLDFYKKEALKYIDEIEPLAVQGSLFDMFSKDLVVGSGQKQITTSINKQSLVEVDNKIEVDNKYECPFCGDNIKNLSNIELTARYVKCKECNYSEIFTETSEKIEENILMESTAEIYCMYCKSSNTLLTDDWIYCADCDQNWKMENTSESPNVSVDLSL